MTERLQRGASVAQLIEAVDATAQSAPNRTALKDGRETLSYAELRDLLCTVPPISCLPNASRVLGVEGRVGDVVELLEAAVSGHDLLVIDGKATAWERGSAVERFHVRPLSAPSPVLCLCTSGTTGLPKLVVLTWPAVLANSLAFARAAGFDRDIIWCSTPLHHRYCLAAGVLAGLLTGSSVLLALGSIGPEEFAQQLLVEQVTTVMSVPFLFTHYIEELARNPELLAHWKVRRCISAGAPLPAEVSERWKAVTGLPILPHYGSTEDGQVTLGRGHDNEGVGQPLADREVKISDAGEMLVRARNDDSAATTAWRATGDVAHMDSDGNVHITGRATDRMNVAGKKVDPTEVEDCLLLHDNVVDCVVGGMPTKHGDEIVAFVVGDESASDADLQSHLAGLLSGHKIPRRFVRLPEIPRTQSGKPRRGLLFGRHL